MISKQLPGKPSTSYAAIKRILFIDPDHPSFYLVSELLEEYNIKVIHVKDGNLALHEFRKSHLDLVIMEPKIPGMNCFDLFAEVKRIKPNIPVIAQAAYVHENMERRCLFMGFNEFISKPAYFELFISLINNHVLLSPGES